MKIFEVKTCISSPFQAKDIVKQVKKSQGLATCVTSEVTDLLQSGTDAKAELVSVTADNCIEKHRLPPRPLGRSGAPSYTNLHVILALSPC